MRLDTVVGDDDVFDDDQSLCMLTTVGSLYSIHSFAGAIRRRRRLALLSAVVVRSQTTRMNELHVGAVVVDLLLLLSRSAVVVAAAVHWYAVAHLPASSVHY